MTKKQPAQKRRVPGEEEETNPIAQAYFGCKFELSCPGHVKHAFEIKVNMKGCPICQTQVTDAERLTIKQTRKMQYFVQGAKDPVYLFQDLIWNLIADPQSAKEKMIKGCQVFMPETVFFKDDGKLDFVTTMDRDCCLSIDTKVKLENLYVRTKLSEIVKERKKDCELYGKQKTISLKQSIQHQFKQGRLILNNVCRS